MGVIAFLIPISLILGGLGLLAFGCTLLVRYHRNILHDG